MKLKGLHFADVAEIQEAVTDELKKAQKEEFSAAFQKLYDRAQKPVCMPVELILNKKGIHFLMFLRFLKKKKSVLNFWIALLRSEDSNPRTGLLQPRI
jgi:DNA topoisomerase IB